MIDSPFICTVQAATKCAESSCSLVVRNQEIKFKLFRCTYREQCGVKQIKVGKDVKKLRFVHRKDMKCAISQSNFFLIYPSAL